MDVNTLEKLATELFADNYKHVHQYWVSPFNADRVQELVEKEARDKKAVERELYQSLRVVVDDINKDSGISAQTYETHKYAINSLARELTGQTWKGGGSPLDFGKEDREGKMATPEQIARFPKDVFFSEGKYGHVNIFDQDRNTSCWEGTLFQTGFDQKGNLEKYRIFHQGHRNALHIASVDLPQLFEDIKKFVADYTDTVPEVAFGLTLDRESYLIKVEAFNALCKDHFQLKIRGEVGNEDIFLQFRENPEQLSNLFVGLGKETGIPLFNWRGSLTYNISRQEPEYAYIDLFLPVHLEGEREEFDPAKHEKSPTVILPYVNPGFTIELLKLYAVAKA